MEVAAIFFSINPKIDVNWREITQIHLPGKLLEVCIFYYNILHKKWFGFTAKSKYFYCYH